MHPKLVFETLLNKDDYILVSLNKKIIKIKIIFILFYFIHYYKLLDFPLIKKILNKENIHYAQINSRKNENLKITFRIRHSAFYNLLISTI